MAKLGLCFEKSAVVKVVNTWVPVPYAFCCAVQNDDSEMARKQREADQLRAAEKFMVVGTGEAECTSCGFIYDPRKGDPEYPVGPGTQFGVRAMHSASLLKLVNPMFCSADEH